MRKTALQLCIFPNTELLLIPNPSVKILISKNLRQVSRKARAQFSLPQRVNLGTDRRGITPEKVFSVMDDKVEGTA